MTCLMKKAKQVLHEGGHTFVLVNGEKQYTSTLTGITPVLCLIKDSPEFLIGATVADKVVGKSAALLFVFAGVSEVYADVISSLALPVLHDAGLKIKYSKKVPFIKNRAGTGMCTMEKSVVEISEPAEGFRILKEKTGIG
ncbi:MAG: DUF1893 domain-containing protein [Oscillospiraceae bacterium]|nr:DUF1893 domain-containing protein [Oscillospiraceae bacterium]